MITRSSVASCMATARTIITESDLVLWSVVSKDLEPRSDGRPCPHQHLCLGSQLSSVCYQGVAMLCTITSTTRVIHRMSSEKFAYPTDRCDMHRRRRASLPDWETVLHLRSTIRPDTPHRAERRNPLPRLMSLAAKRPFSSASNPLGRTSAALN